MNSKFSFLTSTTANTFKDCTIHSLNIINFTLMFLFLSSNLYKLYSGHVILNYDFCRHFDYKNEHTITVCHNILPKFMCVLLFWTQDSDTTGDFTQVPVGVLRVITEDTPPSMNSIAIILEGNIVMDEISTISQAFCLLFGLIYALHLDYPKGMKNTFEFIQKILLNLGQQKLSPKLQTLKNALLG